MSLWRGGRLPTDKVLVGVIGPENAARPGIYTFRGVGGGDQECYEIPDAIVLTPDASLTGSGEHRKPADGSPCVAVFGPGGQVYIIGFALAAKIDLNSEDPPVIGDAADAVGQVNNVAGDKIYSTDGGASLILKRGGSTIIQGGDGVSTQWLKETNTFSTRSQNINELADGFRRVRGRIKVGKTDPETIAVDQYFDQVGSSATRVQVRQGHLDNDARRELTVSKLNFAGGNTTGSIKFREAYFDNGNYVAEGPKFQWGKDADEPAVLGKVFKDFAADVLDTLKDLKVVTAWGPSQTPVQDTKTKIEQIRQKYLSGDKPKILSDYIFVSKSASDPGQVNE